MRWIIPILALAASSGSPALAADAAPSWMTGCWVQEADKAWTEECWMEPRGGIMLGAGRSGAGTKLNEWEATQIVAGLDGKLTYWASPEGRARVAFSLVSQGAQEIVFANPKHDYPQRVRYWREGEALNAEISMADGSKAMRWTYRREQ